MSETQHTPLPLTAYNSYVRDADGNILLHIECNGEPEKERQQAAFIVRACNAHYDLVEIAKELQARLFMTTGNDELYARATAAIAKAKGQL